MHVTARIGAIHLGWDVVSVAAGGGGTPIRPVQVEGTYTPPAYLLADTSGRLHTAGGDRQRSELGIAVSDVRDILGHKQIRIAGATWPAELVFRARLYHPLAAIGSRLRGKPDVVALPFPDDWDDDKIDEYCRLIEEMDVLTDPLPESVALSGYVRALGLVRPPGPGSRGVGATGVYSDGRVCLVVAVDGDDEQPTESVGVPITPDSMRDAHSADNVVIEVMAAARSIGADTSTVLLTGNVCFNDALRLAFQNHLGNRLRVADHPMHALVLGAAHLLVTDSEYADEPDPGPPPGRGAPQSPPPALGEEQGRHARHDAADGPASAANPLQQPPQRPQAPQKHNRTEPPGNPPMSSASGRHAARDPEPRSAPQPRVPGAGDLPGESGSRLTRPPVRPVDEQRMPSAGDVGAAGHKGRGHLFGAPAIAGAIAFSALAVVGDGHPDLVRSGAGSVAVAGAQTAVARVPDGEPDCAMTVRRADAPGPGERSIAGAECAHLAIDNLHYVVPYVPRAIDRGPPRHI